MRRKLDVRSCISLWLVFYLLASRLNISVLAYFLIFFYAPNLLFSSQIINCITCCISFLSVFTHSLYVSHSVFYALTVYPPHSLCIPHHSLYQSLTPYPLSLSVKLFRILSISVSFSQSLSLSLCCTLCLTLSHILSNFHLLSHSFTLCLIFCRPLPRSHSHVSLVFTICPLILAPVFAYLCTKSCSVHLLNI